jgi:hypothetical protein
MQDYVPEFPSPSAPGLLSLLAPGSLFQLQLAPGSLFQLQLAPGSLFLLQLAPGSLFL